MSFKKLGTLRTRVLRAFFCSTNMHTNMRTLSQNNVHESYEKIPVRIFVAFLHVLKFPCAIEKHVHTHEEKSGQERVRSRSNSTGDKALIKAGHNEPQDVADTQTHRLGKQKVGERMGSDRQVRKRPSVLNVDHSCGKLRSCISGVVSCTSAAAISCACVARACERA